MLTVYDGELIGYDNSGNPTNYLGNVLKWEGNQLISYTPTSNSSGKVTPYTYAYDESGIRTRKEVGNTTSEYYYCGELLVGIVSTTRNTDGSTSSITQRFSYDANGTVVALNYNGTYYYYIRNAVGDIVGLIDKTGTTVVSYTYDSWGKLLSTTGSKAGTLGANQPFRYRGYVYDNETGFYYVSSRYYDPEIGRWINADDTAYLGAGGALVSYNLFAYCGNNPLTGYDPDGTWDWGNFFKGSGWIATGVAAVAVGVSVLTCGVAAPVMMAVAAVTVTAGVATTVNGISEIGEAATGHNFMRDDVFRGNSTAYNIYSTATAVVAQVGTAICGGWMAKNAPRISAYNNVENYNYTNTTKNYFPNSDVVAKGNKIRPYMESTWAQKTIIKYGTMIEDSFGYMFKYKNAEIGVNIAKELIWHMLIK